MAFTQTPIQCDTVYEYVANLPVYEGSPESIFNFISEQLEPIISNVKASGQSINFSRLILTINTKGEVSEIDFVGFSGNQIAKSQLMFQIKSMQNWQPARLDGENVCCKFFMPFHCVKMN
jgi:hypothetical protein